MKVILSLYNRTMPDIEALMQQWPPEYEDLLKEVNINRFYISLKYSFFFKLKVNLPSADLNVELPVYVNILCGLLDIPVYKSKIQSLHVLFSLYSEFKNSGVS
jgi:intraflagellar transport protein 46